MKKLLPLIFLPIVFLGCHKDDNEYHYTTTYISDNIKSLAFSGGTYWIYWSDSLQQADSSFLYSDKRDFYEIGYGLNQNYKWEYYSMGCSLGFPSVYSVINMFIESDHMLADPVVGYPQTLGPVLYTYDTANDWHYFNYKLENRYLDSLLVGNRYFHQVQECKFTSKSVHYTCYTAPGFGIVKFVSTVDSVRYTWDLIRWHLVR
jgi:hypothetical protein